MSTACGTLSTPLGPNDELGNSSTAAGHGDGDAGKVDPNSCEAGPISPLVRLGSDDYQRSLRSLFGDAAVDAASSALSGLPSDKLARADAFRRVDHRITDQHLESFYRVADAVAQWLSRDTTARTTLVGSCASTGVDDACLTAFVPGFLQRAYRRPPEADEITRTVELAKGFRDAERVQAVVFTALMSPDFLFQFENRGSPEHGRVRLTGYELAARLSYHFWGEPPDAELLEAAQNGTLGDDTGYAKQVERVYADARTEATLLQFYDQWLQLDHGEVAANSRVMALDSQLDVVGFAAEAREETHDLLRYTLGNGGSWPSVLTSTKSFARSARLAAIYGVPVWDGTSAPPELPKDERSGVLTRAAVLLTGDGSTNPFRRGILLRRAVLCDVVPPPLSTLMPSDLAPPDPQAGLSTRASFAAKVKNEPCASCHGMFAPLGYALESYDGLGRFRTVERLISDNGQELGTSPIDAKVEPRVEGNDARSVDGPVALSQRIAESDKATACLARQYFRFTYRRFELPSDECTIGRLSEKLAAGASLAEAMRALALDPSFRERALEN